ncbi:MAG: 30S ribosomal protein S8e [Candidatus Hydrothermarchaeales archaeon]
MAVQQGESKRKITGGRLRRKRKKKKFEMGGELIKPVIGKKRVKKIRARGGDFKFRVLLAEEANVLVPKTKKCKRSKILSVVENTANPHFARRNIITKGAMILTELGKAKITSRPGQDGIINAVLVE